MEFHYNAEASSSREPLFMDYDDVESDITPLHELDDQSLNSDSSSVDSDREGNVYAVEDEITQGEMVAGPSGTNEDDAMFSRLADYVSRPSSGGLGVGGDIFRDELAAMDQEDLPQRSSRPSRKKSRRPPKPNKEADRLLGRANLAFVNQNHEEAVNLLKEVIRMDPHIRSAWTTLASCYEDLGDRDSGRQMRFFAAHLDEEGESWKELAQEFKAIGETTQCLYCLRKALRQDTGDVDTLWEMASIYRSLGQSTKAVNAFRGIFKANPDMSHNFDLLLDIFPLIVDTGQFEFGAQVFRDSFDWHLANFTGPEDHPPNKMNSMTMQHISATVDLLLGTDELEGAIQVIRQGQRWLQDRSSERHWDSFEDDREYDPPGIQRDSEEDMEDFEGFELDVALRHRLALCRLRLGNDDQAMIHIEEILSLDVMQYHAMFKELGEALMKRDMWHQALEAFAAVQECDELPDDPSMIFSMGICHHQLKEYSQATEALRWVVSNDESNAEAKLRLAAVLEDTSHQAEALDIVTEVLRSRSHRDRVRAQEGTDLIGLPRVLTAGLSRSEKAVTQKLNKNMLEAQAADTMKSLWNDVKEAEQGILDGDNGALNKFIHAAGTMVETYRLAKSNFSKSRGISRVVKHRKNADGNDLTSQALAMQDRLERVMGFEDETPLLESSTGNTNVLIVRTTDFYGINAEDWLNLTVKYCCVLMVKAEEEMAMDILEHVRHSGLFFNKRCEVALRLTIIACAIRMNDHAKIAENCRRLSQIHQFRVDPLLIMLACLGGGRKAHAAWQQTPLQKFIHREVRLYDEAAGGFEMSYSQFNGRWTQIHQVGLSRRLGDEYGRLEGEDSDDEDESNMDDLPVLAKFKKKWKGKKSSAGKKGTGISGGRGLYSETTTGDGSDIVDDDEPVSRTGDAPHENPRPTKRSPALNAIYGQYMLSAKSFQSALFYFFRAYEQNEYDPFLCLSIAQTFLGRAMNRQSDNRNYQIAQALAFLTRYRKLSSKDAQTQEEVEYNYGRSFHTIGVSHLAIVHYERVLSSVKFRMEVADDPEGVRQSSLAYEAAHNLMLLYAVVGNNELVKQRSAWLAI